MKHKVSSNGYIATYSQITARAKKKLVAQLVRKSKNDLSRMLRKEL